jgi:hypothetical protein
MFYCVSILTRNLRFVNPLSIGIRFEYSNQFKPLYSIITGLGQSSLSLSIGL